MRTFFVFCCLIAASLVMAQDSIKDFEFVSAKEGISKVGIQDIIQDNAGLIWIATNGAGLYRFDGIVSSPKNRTV